MLRLLIRYVKYAGTSAFGTLVDTFVLWMLSDHVFTDGFWGEYIVSPVISFQCAVAVNYVISYFFVWKDRTRDRPDASVGRFFRLYLKYNLTNSTVFLLRLGLLLLVERLTGWDVVVCNLTAMLFSGILNFIIDNLNPLSSMKWDRPEIISSTIL